jgi:hypothetical protein
MVIALSFFAGFNVAAFLARWANGKTPNRWATTCLVSAVLAMAAALALSW